ncbi:MAG: type III-B CRISPR-associated protein Cas10/Cmr2 [Syntrophales bacterium]|nr:type III-B CRISPR-associated protein Cas10/Cmr2 [Syntrophales bacterium]
MTWTKPDISYWNNKFAAYWHDPIDKVLSIQKHEERAADYLQIFGIDRPNDEFWKKADAIAAGFERGQVPTYSTDENKNGAVDFARSPIITHPTSGEKGLLKIMGNVMPPDDIHAAIKDFLKRNIGMEASKGDYAARFEQNPDRFAVARLLYTHLVLRFILAEKNIGGLGALWHRIPADSRFPDHSIWQHNALCSAISSCIELGGKSEEAALMVFSITPVQVFISRARKMRDFWMGSILLSWLAFEGLRWVMENLGADHVLYPSLVDQPLVNAYLEREWEVSGVFQPSMWEKQPSEIASLPNKFLFLIPFGKAEEIALELKQAIAEKWAALADLTSAYLIEKKDLQEEEAKYIRAMFTRQTTRFWELQWASVRLADQQDKTELAALLDEGQWKDQISYLEAIKPILEKKGYSVKDVSRGVLYSTSHSLVQSALAAEKLKRSIMRAEEPGEKCQMCGEFEVLHATDSSKTSASGYKDNMASFWNRFVNDDDFNENERLCSVCFIKRYAPRVLKKDKDHILNSVFRDADRFPSTTMMALHDYFRRNKINDENIKREMADNLHKSNTDDVNVKGKEKIKNHDKYYAILLMDGDHMGKLINGETIAATWQGIMPPEIAKRLIKDGFDPSYRDVWRKIYSDAKLNKRLVTPAIHAAISEALGDFSIYGVAPIIARHSGRLIYAGGDDVCAFLPIGSVLSAAREIKDYYASAFRFIGLDRTTTAIENEWTPLPGKLSVNLGMGKDISISAAILICHHKESLTQMIERAQQLLKEKAKEKAERNACAIELRKRHGGSRLFTRRWTENETWDAFETIGKMTGEKRRQVSHSLLYRLEELRPGITAMMAHGVNVENNLRKFVAKQLARSGIKSDAAVEEKIPEWLVHIIWDQTNKNEPFTPEGLLIAGFIGEGGE